MALLFVYRYLTLTLSNDQSILHLSNRNNQDLNLNHISSQLKHYNYKRKSLSLHKNRQRSQVSHENKEIDTQWHSQKTYRVALRLPLLKSSTDLRPYSCNGHLAWIWRPHFQLVAPYSARGKWWSARIWARICSSCNWTMKTKKTSILFANHSMHDSQRSKYARNSASSKKSAPFSFIIMLLKIASPQCSRPDFDRQKNSKIAFPDKRRNN